MKDIDKAAKKLASAYRAYIEANASYNTLLREKDTYTIRWDKRH